MAREMLLAALVLALGFLSFSHSAIALPGSAETAQAYASFCGDPSLPADAGDAPCHACRIGSGADLPPAPLCDLPVRFAEALDSFAADLPGLVTSPLLLTGSPRAPPLA
jgi:hypothetical protein